MSITPNTELVALEISHPRRILYLAIPVLTYNTFFKREFAQMSLERYEIKLIIYDPKQEIIVQWIP